MKVFFDTNVYVAEALLGEAAEAMIEGTAKASWRIFTSPYVLDETERVMTERLGCSSRFAHLTQRRIRRRAALVEPAPSRHRVAADPDPSSTPRNRNLLTEGALRPRHQGLAPGSGSRG